MVLKNQGIQKGSYNEKKFYGAADLIELYLVL